MMTGLYSVTHPVTDALSDLLKNGFQTVGDLAGRSIKYIRNIPKNMQQSQGLAVTVIVISNVVFFIFANTVANLVHNNIERHATEMSPDQKKFQHFLTDGICVGGTVFVLNYIFSRIIQYKLNNLVLLSATATAIFVRVFLNFSNRPEGDDGDNDITKLESDEKKLQTKMNKKDREEKKAEEEKKKSEAEAAKQAEIEKKAEEEKKKSEAEAAKQAEIEKKAEEEKKKSEAEVAKQAEIEKKAEEEKKKLEAEAAKQAEIEKKAEEEKKKLEAELALIEKKEKKLAQAEDTKKDEQNQSDEIEFAEEYKETILFEKINDDKKAESSKPKGLSKFPHFLHNLSPRTPLRTKKKLEQINETLTITINEVLSAQTKWKNSNSRIENAKTNYNDSESIEKLNAKLTKHKKKLDEAKSKCATSMKEACEKIEEINKNQELIKNEGILKTINELNKAINQAKSLFS